MKGNKIIIGSRESRLAVIQSQMVQDFIKSHHPDLEVELLTMKTTGDIILDRTLDKVGGKGLFVKELDRALFRGTQRSFGSQPEGYAHGSTGSTSTGGFLQEERIRGMCWCCRKESGEAGFFKTDRLFQPSDGSFS